MMNCSKRVFVFNCCGEKTTDGMRKTDRLVNMPPLASYSRVFTALKRET